MLAIQSLNANFLAGFCVKKKISVKELLISGLAGLDNGTYWFSHYQGGLVCICLVLVCVC